LAPWRENRAVSGNRPDGFDDDYDNDNDSENANG